MISLSAIDRERFGITTAKASVSNAGDVHGAVAFCAENSVELLIARCPASELGTVQEMERQGFLLMDTLVYYACALEGKKIAAGSGDFVVRQARPGEEEEVKAVAADSFRGYYGHYHADSRLGRKACDDTYTDWAYKSCLSAEVADAVLVAQSGGRIAGFATMCEREGATGEGVLFGVSPAFQGRGIYRGLMTGGMSWCMGRGLGSMLVSTQVTNTAVQKVWCRLGFEPGRSYYTFHKWFTAGG